jgi:hypothetical protein
VIGPPCRNHWRLPQDVSQWITQLVKRAVLKGFKEAVEELDLEDNVLDVLETLKGRMNTLPPSNGEGRKLAKAK